MQWYQINPDYFDQIVDQKKLVGHDQALNFFQLVQENIEYIEQLGCDGIWLMPLYIRGEKHKKGDGSPYAVRRFDLDPQYGSFEDLRNLIAAVHARNMKIITEYIPNHLAPDADFILQNPDVVYSTSSFDQNWTDTVKLNHADPRVITFTTDNMVKILGYGFDGLRLDMAHYVFYDDNDHEIALDNGKNFWQIVFDKLKEKIPHIENYYFVGEVYDDKNKNDSGYVDHAKLIRTGMSVYDKKIHDLLVSKLKYQNNTFSFADAFWQEYQREENVLDNNAISSSQQFPYQFLRFASNHDDNPGSTNFGGVKEYLCALSLLLFMSRDLVLYNGDEYGLKTKLSITGEIKFDSQYHLIESSQVYITDDILVYNTIKKLFCLKKIVTNEFGSKIFPVSVLDNEGKPISDLVVFAQINHKTRKMLLYCINMSCDQELWGKLSQIHDLKSGSYTLFSDSVVHLCTKKFITVEELWDGTIYPQRIKEDDFWIGIKPFGWQVLSVT